MFDFITYLSQSSLCLAAIYLIYKVAMSQETLHRLNRCLLLGSILLSAALPLCRIKIIKEYDPASELSSNIDGILASEIPSIELDVISLLKDIAVVIFFVGVALMLIRLAVKIYTVRRLIHSGHMSTLEGNVKLTVVEKLPSPFSWFDHIVVCQEDIQKYRQMILSHEMAHVRLGHSWDIMAVELALCLWWFNPAMWLLRRELQSLHEYQADNAVLNKGVDAKIYQMLLIKRAVGSRLHSVANCLNHSNLKNRITMMCKKTSSRWSASKVLLVLPVLAISLIAFATTVYVPREVQDKNNLFSSILQDEKTPIIFVNGEKIAYQEFETIAPESIKSITVIKKYDEIPSELKVSESEAEGGVILVELKDEDSVSTAKRKLVTIKSDAFYIDGKKLKAEELQPLFKSLAGEIDIICIDATDETPMDSIIKVKEAARAAGIYKIDYIDSPTILSIKVKKKE